MVKVATSIDGPIKLLWPKSLLFSLERGNTMLGLGDIVVPGTFIALSLRYDYHRASAAGSRLAKTYFYASIAAYVVGLATCMAVMHQFKMAQPALLYLR
jgi:minor histocompatibility antigen H13